MTWLLLALVACQEPFGTNRHDLEGERIAAFSLIKEADGYRPRLAIISQGKPWSDQQPLLEWYPAESAQIAAEMTALPDLLATGPSPLLPTNELGGIAVIATFDNGEERRAWTALTAIPTVISHIEIAAVSGKHIDDIESPDLSADIRLGWELLSNGDIEPGELARLTLTAHGASETRPRARWMTIGGIGTFFELDRSTTDWVAGELVLDGEEVTERVAAEPGASTMLVLAIDDSGGTDWVAQEQWVGPLGTGIVTDTGRWLQTDSPIEGDWIRATLIADDEAPTGLRLDDATVVTSLSATEDTWGTLALACDGVRGPFDPNWLLDGRCTRDAVVGQSVVMRTQ